MFMVTLYLSSLCCLHNIFSPYLYSYPVFPTSLDPTLFNPAPASTNSAHSKLMYTPTVSLGSGSPMVARRTPAEKAKDRQV